MIQLESINSKTRYRNRKIYQPPPKQDYSSNFKKLIIVIIISFVFIAGQFVGGIISGSISVISDAFHLVTDLLGFVVSFVFIWFSRKKPTQIMSFGYHRMQLMGALGNLFIIWGLACFLIYEATLRIIHKQFVKQPLAMLIVAAAGLPINIIMYFVLHSGSSHSHGLMSQKCGEQFPIQQDKSSNQLCSQILCQDIQCLISNQYEDHCHKKQGENQQIHKHRNKVLVEGNKIIRKSSKDITQEIGNEDHSNCKGHIHSHQNKQNRKNNKITNEIGLNRQQIHQHEHDGHQCSDNHSHSHSHKNQSNRDNSINNIHEPQVDAHNHSQSCNHGHNKGTHNHDHEHQHDHGHDHDHDHHGHDHGHGHSHQSMSMKAAVLHALSDVIQSIGLLISSLIIFFAGSDKGKQVLQWNDWHYLDPVATYIFSTIVFISTVPIAKNCYYIIMESTPSHISASQIQQQFSKIEGIVDVHDLHIWDLRPGKTILIAHVFSKAGEQRAILKRLTDLARKKRIYHSTFQVEEHNWKHHQQYILCDHDIH